MKPIRFVCGEPSPRFGVVVGACAVALAALRTASGKSYAQLADSRTNLANLPDREAAASELLAGSQQHVDELAEYDRPALDAVHVLEPVEVAARPPSARDHATQILRDDP